MKIENSKGKSPYARHAKAPYKYSDYYDRWATAIAQYGRYSEQAMQADTRFRQVFGIPTTGINFRLGSSYDA